MIEELLHTGMQNALSPEYLAAVTGLDKCKGCTETDREGAPERCSHSFQYSAAGRLLFAGE